MKPIALEIKALYDTVLIEKGVPLPAHFHLEKKKNDKDNILVLKNKNGNISTKKTELKSTNADWSPVYNGLDSEIKLRL